MLPSNHDQQWVAKRRFNSSSPTESNQGPRAWPGNHCEDSQNPYVTLILATDGGIPEYCVPWYLFSSLRSRRAVFDAARVVSEPPGVMAPGPPKVVWCVLCIWGHQGDFRKSRKDAAALEPRLSLTPISRIRPREFQAPCPSFSPTGQVNRGQTVRARPINALEPRLSLAEDSREGL